MCQGGRKSILVSVGVKGSHAHLIEISLEWIGLNLRELPNFNSG